MSIRIGFIGVGGMANIHLPRLAKIEGVKIVSLCDVVPEKVEETARKYQAASYDDYRKMLDREDLDALYICLPPFAHKDIEIEVAKKGIPFFIEKPINLYLEKTKEVEKIVREKNLITSVGYCLRYMDILDKAKEILRDKKIAMVLGRYFGEVPGGGKGWYSRKEKSGGQIVEQATHIVDLMRYLVGEVDSLYGEGFKGLNKIKNYDVEDASVVALNFQNGAIGSLACNWLLSGYASSLEIITKGLQIQYSENSLKVITEKKREEFLSNDDFYLVEDKVFIEAIRSNDPAKIKSDYSDGLKTLEVTLSANKSIENGEEIKLWKRD